MTKWIVKNKSFAKKLRNIQKFKIKPTVAVFKVAWKFLVESLYDI